MGVKISELAENTNISGEDVIPIVSVEDGTKKFKVSTLLNMIFPIGSTYITQTDANPSTILGFGTWERLKGKICLGVDENDTDLNKVGNTGGEKNHVLTLSEIPAHRHEGLRWENVDPVTLNGGSQAGYNLSYSGGNNGAHDSLTTTIAGGGLAHNNMPPYEIVGYMWIRKS